MSVSRDLKWSKVKSTDTLAVLGVLRAELADILSDTKLQLGNYHVTTPSGISLHNVRDIRKELLPTGETTPQYIAVEFAHPQWKTSKSLSRVRLSVSGYISMSLEVAVWGEANNEYFGFVETTKNRLTAVIDKRNESGWSRAEPESGALRAGTGETDPSAVELSRGESGILKTASGAVPTSPTHGTALVSAKNGWLKNPDSVSRHPLIVTLVSVTLTLALALVVGLAFHLGPFKPASEAPPSSPVTTSPIAPPTTSTSTTSSISATDPTAPPL